MSFIPTTRNSSLRCKRKADNAEEFEAERIQPADRQPLVATRISHDAATDKKVTDSPKALSALPQGKQNVTPQTKRPRLILKFSPGKNKTRKRNQLADLDRHNAQNGPGFNALVSTAQNPKPIFASESAVRSTIRRTPNGTNSATAQPNRTIAVELSPPRNRDKPISIADLDAQLYPGKKETKQGATPRDHLDVTPDMAEIKRFKRLEHDSAPDGYDLKLPRSLADPKRYGLESGVLDYSKMHDPERKAPWAPLAVFDSRLTMAHEQHAIVFEERATRPETQKDGTDPDEDDVEDEQVDWVRQKQVARMSTKYRETMRKGLKKTQGDLVLEEQHAGQQLSILDRLRAGELSPESPAEISGADAHGEHDIDAQHDDDDVEMKETYRREEHEHEEDWRVQQLLLGADAPIGVFNKHEVALHRARKEGRAGKRGSVYAEDLHRLEARKALVGQGRIPAFLVDKN
ncbi:hypothetical protein KC351_g16683 [Hortaea werneckii]|nr:hypothetical protein KC351_g16683 [Hortaea werneckii]